MGLQTNFKVAMAMKMRMREVGGTFVVFVDKLCYKNRASTHIGGRV